MITTTIKRQLFLLVLPDLSFFNMCYQHNFPASAAFLLPSPKRLNSAIQLSGQKFQIFGLPGYEDGRLFMEENH
jgi:hypothetical protein